MLLMMWAGANGSVHYIGHIPVDMYAKAGEGKIDNRFTIQV